jgi:hypothetical protein
VAARGEQAEPADVEFVADLDQVTGRVGLDQVGAWRPQCRPQTLDRAVQGAARTRRRLALPQNLGERVEADHTPGVQQQRRQQDALPGRGHRHRSRAIADQQRPEQPEMHASTPRPGNGRTTAVLTPR